MLDMGYPWLECTAGISSCCSCANQPTPCKPAGPMELHDWQAQDAVLLNAALNEIWTRWDRGASAWLTTLWASAWISSIPAWPLRLLVLSASGYAGE